MVAGPSEVLIVCDGKKQTQIGLLWIFFLRLKHDENAQAILVSNDDKLLEAS